MLKSYQIMHYILEVFIMKKLKNTNLLFAVALTMGLLLHIVFVFILTVSNDESFYAVVPFRLINGDSLIQHEWHLTQFSSLFAYLPVYIWTAIKGSTEGMFVFLRCVYLFIHTIIAVGIYVFFKKYGKWAVMASMIFYVQIAYRILAVGYPSMFVMFLLLLSLCLISIYQKHSSASYIFAGICFGCCCVCNPFFCFALSLYIIVCALWTKRISIQNFITKIKTSKSSQKDKKLTKKQKREQKQQLLQAFPDMDSYTCFFTKNAILKIACGILIAAIIAIAFYLLTGGTLAAIPKNIENLLGSTEYNIVSYSIFSKLIETVGYFNVANLGMPWILPAIFIALLFDKKRRHYAHRLVYLLLALVWSFIFIFAVLSIADGRMCAISLPFFVLSTICYWLTEKKNKTIFYCMYIPSLIATVFQYLAADTHWAAIGIVLAVSNIAGVFFAMDLCKEMRSASKQESTTKPTKIFSRLCSCIIAFSFCLQILFYGAFYAYGQIPESDSAKATSGPYKGLYMNEYQHNQYSKLINDMDIIKARSGENDPVLLVSYNNWMYLYLDRPLAVHTAWYRGNLDSQQLSNYYKENPEKAPKYIYIESSDPNSSTVEMVSSVVSEMFTYSKENLSNGVLLTVEYCIF